MTVPLPSALLTRSREDVERSLRESVVPSEDPAAARPLLEARPTEEGYSWCVYIRERFEGQVLASGVVSAVSGEVLTASVVARRIITELTGLQISYPQLRVVLVAGANPLVDELKCQSSGQAKVRFRSTVGQIETVSYRKPRAILAADGSYSKRFSIPGWGWLREDGEFGFGSDRYLKNIFHAELCAVLSALEQSHQSADCDVLTDNAQVLRFMTRLQANPERRESLAKQLPAPLKRTVRQFAGIERATFNKVLSHSGDPLRDGADRLATLGRRVVQIGGGSRAGAAEISQNIRDEALIDLRTQKLGRTA
ncbi:hypothetical protein [Lysinibacter cavernae]|uniref:hypothetical protein n=1 Tax=Lysinibacter cavernae TaxID=1640652 RepID=UPI003621D115